MIKIFRTLGRRYSNLRQSIRTSVRRNLHVFYGIMSCTTLESLNFDNLALRSLPIDPEKENSIRQVSGACFSKVKPTPVSNPRLVAASISALSLIDLDPGQIERKDFAEFFSGNKLLPGSDTAAHCYCGHQFGYFSGQLGDGAAMYLGEIVNKSGQRWEIQFKGSGLTPFSRSADGRKVLRSTIREFLCSEAIHNLGIPTTRAGTCVTSDSRVVRDIFYDGNPIQERCSIVLRIAPTFLRFGSFEIFKPTDSETGRKGPSVGRNEILTQMLDYTVQTFYPEIWKVHNADKMTAYVEFFKELTRRTARLVADWQSVGWCHGVLNTDNMSIVGVTIDYGPFGFMDKYDPGFICNASDDGGRYTYIKQPQICKWNIKKFAEAIQGVVPLAKTIPETKIFDEEYSDYYTKKMRKKFGLVNKSEEQDGDLTGSFLDTMQKTGADFTNCFRCLSRLPLPGSPDFEDRLQEVIKYILSQCSTVEELKKEYRPRMDPRQFQMMMMLMESNPQLAPALGRSFSAFSQEIERLEKFKELEKITEDDKQKENKELWTTWFKSYTDRLKKEVEGETDIEAANQRRKEVMNGTNPRFILRNYIAQNAIDAAEKGDFSEVCRVLKLLETPYNDGTDLESLRPSPSDSNIAAEDDSSSSVPKTFVEKCYDGKPPSWSVDLRVT
ncbi:protein adenylyltransferase SelO, mitochondrial-like [Ostrea edulis]|uniref:protein adenylyltransferase SelO, mitochondrial-like n=1 Tax=Ostrea edulis TaxID=37623 RepID=UPI0024AEBACA|nr:protein adenylyltransferase SelO, mitochondrial-like [Ostrea edulis]